MRSAMSQLNLSARTYHRILKLARTIADLVGNEEIQSADVADALQYRPKLLLNQAEFIASQIKHRSTDECLKRSVFVLRICFCADLV